MPKTDSADQRVANKRRVRKIVRRLAKAYAGAECALRHENPFQLAVATILSAQCTDERVNMVTPAVFERFPTAECLAMANQKDVETLINSTGFFRSKAKNLCGMGRMVVAQHGGKLPRTLDELIQLPGIGRKTANVVLGTAFGIPSGVVVDTHVKRISYRLGLTEQTSPEKVEQDLMAILPKSEWIDFSHRLIHHGRQICKARKPACEECPLLDCCPRVGLPPLK